MPRLVVLANAAGTNEVAARRYLADITAPNTAAEVAEGAVKPESAAAVAETIEPVQTIASWVQATRQALDDEPAALGWLEQRLVTDVRRRLTSQVLVGNGTAPNLRGFLNRSGIGTYLAPAGEAAVISLRKAITVAETSGQQVTAYVVSTADAEKMALDVNSQGAWRGVPPSVTARQIVDAAMPAGRVLVGDFRDSAALLVREDGSVYMSDSHASTFTSNILTLLAEGRYGLALWRPGAFCAATLAA